MCELLEKLIEAGKSCYGCGACYNVCPVSAIAMIADEEGFLQPVIDHDKCTDCHLCESKCPILKPKLDNNENPECYVMMASDEIRKTSSSGGFIYTLSKYIFERNGVVFGAVWNTEDWSVYHRYIDNLDDLYLIQSSKYMQSDTKYTFKEVDKFLREDRYVLYTGLPCQIAGLYNSLKPKTPTDKLITVDILCHGVPSHKSFRKYLEDNFDVNRIKHIDFRDKAKYGWSTTTTIIYNDNSEHRISEKDCPYYKAFLPCMILRKSCSQCGVSRLPRQGDFTAGDFWGIERYNPKYNDKKGTSLILINNEKAKTISEDIKENMKLWEQVDINYATRINKTILHPFGVHSGRKHFFSSFNLKPFNELVESSLQHKYDIGIVGLWYGLNYGSVLTYFALYSLLRDLKYDPVMLPKPNNLWDERFNNTNTIAQKFIWKHCNVFIPFKNQYEYKRVNDLCQDFILGSDVVWSYDICGKETDQFFFLDWVEKGHKKIAFAASLENSLKGSKKYIDEAIINLNTFDLISVREKSVVSDINNLTGRNDVKHVLDPVFCCNKNIYEECIRESQVKKSNEAFVFVYILRRFIIKPCLNIIDYLCEKQNYIYKACANPMTPRNIVQEYFGDNLLDMISIEDWLYYVKNASYYIGDSYHALCFSLIFHTPFIITAGDNKSFNIVRFKSLLKFLDLEDRILYDLDDKDAFINILNKEINWTKVDTKLDIFKQESINILQSALVENNPRISSDDLAINKLSRNINELFILLNSNLDKIKELEAILNKNNEEIHNIVIANQNNFDELTNIANKQKIFNDEITIKIQQLENRTFKSLLKRIIKKLKNIIKY